MDAHLIEQLRQVAPAGFYRPNRAASEESIKLWGGTPGVSRSRGDAPFFASQKPVRVSSGGNRSGKTTKCVLEAGSNCIGFRPWMPIGSHHATAGLVQPHRHGKVRGVCVMANFETKMPDIRAELEKWWPREWWRVSAGSKKDPREIEWFNGSTIRFISHKLQDRGDAEGIEADFFWYDEPPPEWLWIALNRGIVSTGGRIFIGATLLDKSGWFWDSVIAPGEADPDSHIDVFWHSIWDNCAENGGLHTQKAKQVKNWLDGITDPDERLAREHGHPMHVGGLVLSGFDRREHIVDPFELPHDAVIYSAIDPGGAKPMAAAWMAVVPSVKQGKLPEVHLFDESYDVRSRNDLAFFAQDFRVKEAGMGEIFHPSRSVYTIIDPYANQAQKADVMGRTMTEILFEEYNIVTVDADRSNKRARLASLNGRFRSDQLRIWRNCQRFIYESGKWTWRPESPKLTEGEDDVCDCASYIESFDPVRSAITATQEEEFGVWLPKEYRRQRAPGESPFATKSRIEHRRRLAERRALKERLGS